MAVAQLLFDAHDRLWHVLSSKAFEQSDRMHPTRPDDATLVPIPVLPVGLVYVGPIGQLLVTEDPAQAIEEQQAMLDRRRRDQCQQFLDDKLTPGERRLVKTLLREVMVHHRSPTNYDLARQLVLSERTVRNRFSEIYAKMREFFDLYDEPLDNKLLIGLYAPTSTTSSAETASSADSRSPSICPAYPPLSSPKSGQLTLSMGPTR